MNKIILTILLTLIPLPLHSQALAVDLRAVRTDTVGVLSFAKADASPNFNFSLFPFRGGWGVTSAAFAGQIFFFRDDHEWKGEVGRVGEGPGEFKGMLRGVESGTGLIVLDPRLNRASWLDSTFQFVESRPIPGRIFSAQSDGSGGALLGGQFTSGSTVYTVLGVGPEVDDRFRLGAPSISARPQEDFAIILPPVDGEIWSVKYSGGVIEILNASSLEVEAQLRLPFEEYRAAAPQRFNVQRNPPTPQIVGGSASADGHGLIFAAVADANWEPRRAQPSDFYDTEVLIVDLARRTVLGRIRFPGFCMPMGEYLAGCVDDLGNILVHKLRLDQG